MKFAAHLFVVLLVLGIVSSATAETINFDSLTQGVSSSDLNNYLAGHGITVSGLTSGTYLMTLDDRLVYGGGYVEASSPHILLTQGGSNSSIEYTLNFDTPLSSLSFTRITEKAGPSGGTSYASWNFQVFEGSNQIGSGGQGSHSLWGSSVNPAQTFTYTGTGITRLRISSYGGSAAFNSVLLDDFVTQPVPEPSTLILSGMGVAALVFFRRRRQK